MKIAAVTMTHNEPDMLPLWLRHYAEYDRFVIDHGTTDGSTTGIPAELVRLPPSKHDNRARADFVEDFTRTLLRDYDAVLFVDVDELVATDPAGMSLQAIVSMMRVPYLNAIGLNVVHKLGEEPALDPSLPILGQRRYVMPTASMCKPVLIREPVRWSPGFHCAGPLRFGLLFLFHLAYADRQIAMRRQAKRRGVDGASPHHLAQDDEVTAWMEGWAAMPTRTPTLALPGCAVLRNYLDRMEASQEGREGEVYRYDLNIPPDGLWAVPDRFLGVV